MMRQEHAPLPVGMDQQYYAFRPLVDAPAIPWPDRSRIALVVLLHLEYWQLAPAAGIERDRRFVGEYGSFSPDYRTWSQREYGNRVGFARVMSVLDKYRLKLTVPVNAASVGRHAVLLDELKQRGAEFVGHGTAANHILSSRLDEAQERAIIVQSLDAIEQGTGVRPRGWAGQDAGESARTPALLAELGLDYVLDWPNDDAPYLMNTRPRRLVSLPRQPEWDDVEQLWLRRIETVRYPDLVGEAFETLYGEGGRVFVLSLHPWLMGMAHRVRYLDEALARIAGFEGVWQATAADVACRARQKLEAEAAQ